MTVHEQNPVVPAYVAGTTPYPWPYNAELSAEATAVIVVVPAASAASFDDQKGRVVGANAIRIAQAIAAAGGIVIKTTTQPPPHAEQGSLDWFDALAPVESTTSAGIDAFFGSSLDSVLRQRKIERLIFTGVGLETSVHSTMRTANDRGFECLLVIDACLSYDDALTHSSVSMIEMSGGIFGAVGHSSAVLDAYRAR